MRILLVEDYEPLAFLLLSICQKIGNQVDAVFTLADAFVKLDEMPPCDVIFLDLTLLDSGPESTIAAIPKLKAKAGKLVVMTGNPKEELVVTAMKLGADDYIINNHPDFAGIVQSYMEDANFHRSWVSTPI